MLQAVFIAAASAFDLLSLFVDRIHLTLYISLNFFCFKALFGLCFIGFVV